MTGFGEGKNQITRKKWPMDAVGKETRKRQKKMVGLR